MSTQGLPLENYASDPGECFRIFFGSVLSIDNLIFFLQEEDGQEENNGEEEYRDPGEEEHLNEEEHPNEEDSELPTNEEEQHYDG
jgi:hypothetical protein